MTFISTIPILVALPLFAAVFAAAAVAMHTVLRPFLPPAEHLSEHNEVPGFLSGIVGALYAIVLGFLVGTVWTAFATAQQTVDLEAGDIGNAFNFANQLPPLQGHNLQRLLAKYAVSVRQQDWSVQSAAADDAAGDLLLKASRVAFSIPTIPKDASSAQLLETTSARATEIDSLRQIGDERRLRLVQARSRLPAGLVEALLLGAMFVVSFTFFFGVGSYFKQMLMTALLAGSIGLFFGLVVELSTPYRGSIHVSRDSFDLVIANNHLTEIAK